MRVRAAMAATAIAEYFRARGKRVLLLVDSRHALRAWPSARSASPRASRPTSRGYPPSVFAMLPRLLERAGNDAGTGSITALYTVLAEGDDMADPVADAARAMLDGHIVLSRKLAQARTTSPPSTCSSVSRVMSDVTDADHRALARRRASCWPRTRSRRSHRGRGLRRRHQPPRRRAPSAASTRVNAFLRQEPDQRFVLVDTLSTLRRALDGQSPPEERHA